MCEIDAPHRTSRRIPNMPPIIQSGQTISWRIRFTFFAAAGPTQFNGIPHREHPHSSQQKPERKRASTRNALKAHTCSKDEKQKCPTKHLGNTSHGVFAPNLHRIPRHTKVEILCGEHINTAHDSNRAKPDFPRKKRTTKNVVTACTGRFHSTEYLFT